MDDFWNSSIDYYFVLLVLVYVLVLLCPFEISHINMDGHVGGLHARKFLLLISNILYAKK
jgi:hypothetical protein